MVTRKITRHVAQWMVGDFVELRLGNPDSRRDWGYAKDYVRAMQLMLQPDSPQDYVVGSGEAHSVREFLAEALRVAGLENKELPVVFNAPEFNRPAELHCLVANWSKVRHDLGWEPHASFKHLVTVMVEGDYQKARATQKYGVVTA